MRKVKLKTGNMLVINDADFDTANELYQVLMEELKVLNLQFSEKVDINFIKNCLCSALGSKKISAALWPCLEKCTYNDEAIKKSIFEPVAAREDYFEICFEVAKENVLPFLKSLYAQFEPQFREAFAFLK